MEQANIRFLTAESVRAGHPDKLCDRIADRILDELLTKDPNSRAAIEAFATQNKLLVAGEVTSEADICYDDIAWETIESTGYKRADLCAEDDDVVNIEISVHEQSPDIAAAVDGHENGDGVKTDADNIGAGDQGIMIGYATDETPEMLPLPVVLAHGLCREMDRLMNEAAWLGVDGKAQVTVAYENGAPKVVTTIVLSAQHDKRVYLPHIRKVLLEKVIKRVIPAHLLKANTRILVNPSGAFVLGGPAADTGLTGRKLAVDQYGPAAHIAGGALSGKDATKVDRSGAYAARWVAKNIVAAKIAKRCEVQLAYAIGVAKPVSITVDTFGTGIVPDTAISLAVKEVFDLRVGAIIKQLGLRSPIYAPLAVYGHFGRPELNLPWECVDRKWPLVCALIQLGYMV